MQASISKQTVWSVTKQNTLKVIIDKIRGIPLHAYGQGLLIVAVFLSALGWIYLRTLQREQMHQLQSAQQYTEQLEQRWHQLGVIHDTWSSPDRIHALAQTQGLITPSVKNRVAFGQHD